MKTGKIRNIAGDKGYGFIRDTEGKDYFFHASATDGEFMNLVAERLTGDVNVEFEPTESPRGLRAENVRRING